MRAFEPAKGGHTMVSVGVRSAVPSPFLAAAYLGGASGEVKYILSCPMTQKVCLANLRISGTIEV